MKELRIIDIIGSPNAILHKFGMAVFTEVKQYLDKGETVQLSFEGLKGLTTAFCHASIGNIYEAFGQQTPNIFQYTGINGHKIWEDKIREAIEFAQNPPKREFQQQLINELFD